MFWFILLVLVFMVQAETEVALTDLEPTTLSTLAVTTTLSTVGVTTSGTTTTLNHTTITTTLSTGGVTTSEIAAQSLSTEESVPSVSVIDELGSLGHGVRSGKIMITGKATFEIPNFHFDGKAPTAYFMVGKGESVSGNGTRVYPDGTTAALAAYDGQSVELRLPNSLTVDDIDWLAVWCEKYSQNLGYVFVHKKSFPHPPQTFNLNNKVTSGPVVLVNKKSLFVPNFRYNGDYKGVNFWVGNGTEPSAEGIPVPDENGSMENLHPYQGQNLYINLPGDTTTDNIEYFGVWSRDEEISLGHVPIKGIENVPEAPSQTKESENLTMRLPKCCPDDSVLTSNGCIEKPSTTFLPTFKVYEHNETHFSNESLNVTLIQFVPYNSVPDCEAGKYPLDEENEEFALLLNGSLLVKGAAVSGILSSDQFCLDNVEYGNETSIMKILVCVPEYKIQKAMFITYVTFTIISTFCFAITFFLYFFWLNVKDIHKKCFTAYSFTMTITFLSLTIVQTANVEDGACAVLGFFFQIFMIASFTLLGILCVDIFIIIKYIDELRYQRQRKFWYLIVAVGVPFVFLITSLARNFTPDVPNSFFKPQYLRNNCYFEAESQRTIIFYVPICVSIITGMGFLLLTKLQIVNNDRHNANNYFWLTEGTLYKFMFRQCLLTLVIMVVSWISNILMSFLDESSGIFNAAIIFESLQGVLIVGVFTMNHHYSTYLRRRQNVTELVNVEMTPLNQNNHTDE